MRNWIKKKAVNKLKRGMRVRRKLRSVCDRPRLSIVKTNCHIHVQLINDENGETLVSSGTNCKEFRNTEFNRKSKASARKLGTHFAELAQKKNIKEVLFDRGPFKYHGILAEFASAAREQGLQF